MWGCEALRDRWRGALEQLMNNETVEEERNYIIIVKGSTVVHGGTQGQNDVERKEAKDSLRK